MKLVAPTCGNTKKAKVTDFCGLSFRDRAGFHGRKRNRGTQKERLLREKTRFGELRKKAKVSKNTIGQLGRPKPRSLTRR